VHAGRGRALGVLAVQVVGQRDVHGVDAALEAFLELLVAVARFRPHPVSLAEDAELGGVVGDERGQLRVARGVLEGGQHRDLRDVPQADDGVADLAAGSRAS
jgi:hypothetical protein